MNQIDQKLRVGFLLLDNFTLNAFSGFIEAVRLAADQGGRSQQIACGWQMMSQGRVTASCGLSVAATRDLSDPSEMDYLARISQTKRCIRAEDLG
jgi:transcriptional regulator GlxA family with amidase domain